MTLKALKGMKVFTGTSKVEEQKIDNKNTNYEHIQVENIEEKPIIDENNTNKENNKLLNSSIKPSEPSEPSEILTEEDNRRLLQQGAYWSDSLWHCKHCKFSYDKPGMVEHLRLKV